MTLREALDILELNPNTLDRTILETSLKKHLEGIELRNVMRLLEAYRKANAFINPTLATHGDVRVTMIDEPVPDGPPLNLRPAAKRLAADSSSQLKRDFAPGTTFDESILKAPNSASAPVYDPKAFETQEMMIGEMLPPPNLKSDKNIEVVPNKPQKAPKQNAAGFWGMVGLGAVAAASLGYFGASQLLPPLLGAPNPVSAQSRPGSSQPTTPSVNKPTVSVAAKPSTTSIKPVTPKPSTPSVNSKTPNQAAVSSNTVSSSATKPATPSATKPATPSVTKPTTTNQTTVANAKPVATTTTTAAKLEAARQAKLEAARQAKLKAERAAKLETERLAQAKLKADQAALARAEANRQAALLAQRQAAQQAAQRRADANAERLAAQRLTAQREAQRLAAQREAQRLTVQRETQRLAAQREAQRLAAQRQAEQAAARRAATQAARRAAASAVSVRAVNQGSFATWDRAGAVLRYASWAAIPDSVRALPPAQFRASVYVASSPATLPGIPR